MGLCRHDHRVRHTYANGQAPHMNWKAYAAQAQSLASNRIHIGINKSNKSMLELGDLGRKRANVRSRKATSVSNSCTQIP